jgi:hypothetical protein
MVSHPTTTLTAGSPWRYASVGQQWQRTFGITRTTHTKPGELWVWGGVGGVRIINLLTQEGEQGHGTRPGQASLSNVRHCLRRLKHELEKGEVKSLAVPKLDIGV